MDRLVDWWVVIVAYNRYDLVTESAKAFLTQAPPPHRVLVIDNSDTPDHRVLDGLGIQWLSGHAATGNSGSAGGFALGMDYAFEHGAAYVVLSDQDFVPERGLLFNLWKTAERYPAAAVSSFTVDRSTNEVMPAFLAAAPEAQPDQVCLAPNRHEMVQSLGWTIGSVRFTSLASIQEYAARTGADIGRVPLACPQGLAVSREIHESIGTFRRDFFVGWEDYDYCCRLQDSGYLLLLALGAVGYHHLSWHRTVRLGPIVLKPFDNDPHRFYFHIRNSIVMAKERAHGRVFAKWMLRLSYHSLVYLVLGPSSVGRRAIAIQRAWRCGLRHDLGAAPRQQVRARDLQAGKGVGNS